MTGDAKSNASGGDGCAQQVERVSERRLRVVGHLERVLTFEKTTIKRELMFVCFTSRGLVSLFSSERAFTRRGGQHESGMTDEGVEQGGWKCSFTRNGRSCGTVNKRRVCQRR